MADIESFPTGDSASYSRSISRSIDLSGEVADFVRDGNAVIVVHGLDPAMMPGGTALADSAISEDLPLAATAPVLCGVLTEDGDGMFTAELSSTNPVAAASGMSDGDEPTDEMADGDGEASATRDGDAQVSEMPVDGVAAGGGSTANAGLLLGLLTLTAGLLALAATGVDGRTAVFEVEHVAQYDQDEFPTEDVYGNLDHAGLRPISCGGVFDRASSTYEDNIVVHARFLTSHTTPDRE